MFFDPSITTPLQKMLDYDSSGNLIYVGEAAQGASQNANVWTIYKLVYTGANLTNVQVLFNVAWANRTTLPWS
jgi:hypothetical protein